MQTEKLKEKIVTAGLDNIRFSKLLGINESTLYRKLNKKGLTFTIEEVNNMISILNLSDKDVLNIFFDEKLA